MNPQITVSIYQLKSGPHQVSFFNPITRKRIRRKFGKRAEAETFVHDLREQYAANGLDGSSALLISQWMKMYLEAKPNAFIKRLGEPMFRSFVETFGQKPAMAVTRDALLEWVAYLKQARNYSDRTLPNIKSSVNQFFQFMVDVGALRVNPMEKIKIKRGLPKKERVVLNESEISDLLNRIKEVSPHVLFPVVFLLAHTGARLGEILKLQWKDINFDTGTIHLLKTKNGDDRQIHVSRRIIEFLKSLPRNSEHVVLNIHGQPWTDEQYRKQFNKFRLKIGFEKYWCNHSLRHSFATNYQKQGGSMTQLQKILGHRDLQMTVDLYGKIEGKDILEPSPFNF